MDEKVFEWLEQFIDAKISYELRIRDLKKARYKFSPEYEEEYRLSSEKKKKEIDQLRKDILSLIKCVKHSDHINSKL